MFGFLQCVIGGEAKEFGHSDGRAGPGQHCRNADTHREPSFPGASSGSGGTEIVDSRLYPLGNFGGTARIGRGKDDSEVFCAVAGGEIRYPQSPNHFRGGFRQAAVPFPVLTPIMKLPEMIKVEQQQRDVGTFPEGAVPLALQGVIKSALAWKVR